MRDVAVIGVGMSQWGECWDKSLRDLFVDAALAAIDDSGVDHIDAMYVGCMSSGLFNGQEHIAPMLAEYLGVNPIPATRVESACASGGLSFRQAWMAVAGGFCDIVLASGVEKMTDVDGGDATYALGTAADQDYESFHGISFPGLYALMARLYMEKYGLSREELAAVPAKNHANGAKNSRSQFPHPVSVEQVMNSSLVAEPLRLLDCSPITDGAAAVILCPLEKAASFSKKKLVKVIGTGQATDTIALHSREDITYFKSTEAAAKMAFDMAKIKPENIDFAEVHDCFSIAEIIAIESLGFFEKGKGGKASAEGMTQIGGKIPINTSGGLKSKGHPVGATGIAQVVETVEQLRGESGSRQVKDAKVGLTQNMGGTAASSVVTILEAC